MKPAFIALPNVLCVYCGHLARVDALSEGLHTAGKVSVRIACNTCQTTMFAKLPLIEECCE